MTPGTWSLESQSNSFSWFRDRNEPTWPGSTCVRFGASRSGVRLSVGSYNDLVNWYYSLLTRRTVCGRAAMDVQSCRQNRFQWWQTL